MQTYMFVYHDKDGENTHALFYDSYAEVTAVCDAFKAVGFKGTEMYVRVNGKYEKMD